MHVLIVGTTLSGKTTVARQLAKKANKLNRGVLVFDPVGDPRWIENGADCVTDNSDLFLHLAQKNENCSLYIDEAGDFCNRYATESFWLATRSRHKGHQSTFICQRPAMIGKNIRDNCDKLFCFRISPYDAKEMANDFCCQELLKAPELEKGQFIYLKRYEKPLLLNAFQNNA